MTWKAATRLDYMRQDVELVLWRNSGDMVEVVIGFTDHGDAIVERRDSALATPEHLPRIPTEALQALVEHVKPGASSAEVQRLEEALTIERTRVDSLLARIAKLTP